jgi:hypothetical protein
MFGKNSLVSAAFWISSHAFCHFIIVSSSNSLYIVLLGSLLYVIVFLLSVTAANHGPSDIPIHPTTATKGNTKEGNIKTRNLAFKQTRINN